MHLANLNFPRRRDYRWRRLIAKVLLPGMVLVAPGHDLAAQAQPDSGKIILSLPHLVVPAEADTVVIDAGLRNLQAAVGGLRVDLDIAAEDVTLDTVLTTARTAGWRVDLASEQGRAFHRILLFDPAGRNIAPGSGPVMRLVLALPSGGSLQAEVPLILAAASISDPVGVELAAEREDGSLSVGAQILLSLGSAQAGQGETARLPLALSNVGPVAGFQASFGWDSTALELLDVATTKRSARLQLEWDRDDSGAWVWLYAPAGKELRPGSGDILTLSFAVAEGAYPLEAQVAVRDARVMERGGRQRIMIGTAPGRLLVFPGYLDPPRDLTAISGQDGRVTLSWAASGGRTLPPALGQPSLALTGYHVYRAEAPPMPSAGANPLATIGPAHRAYVDTTVVNGQAYFYAVTATYAHRFESALSDPAAATPSSWVTFGVGHATAQAGEWVVIPVRLKNELPVAGVRFELHGAPAALLFAPRVELGPHCPPDWVVSVEQDTVAGAVSVVGFSPRLTTIGPGEGVAFRLLMQTAAADPATISLMPEHVVISNGQGDPYNAHVTAGSVTITLSRVELRIGTGAPTQPGDTGYVAVYMDNPLPVAAFQFRIGVDSEALQVVEVRGTPRLPADGHLTRTDLGGGDIRLIGASFANRAIASGTGSVARIAYRVAPGTAEGFIGVGLAEAALSDVNGRALRGTSISGAFPVGTVRAVFLAAISEGEPGRTVTLPVGVTNSV
ncbi:MAG: cohesin domain-containing protein, partial [Candidatus Neomarinimicrobiota bacterium]